MNKLLRFYILLLFILYRAIISAQIIQVDDSFEGGFITKSAQLNTKPISGKNLYFDQQFKRNPMFAFNFGKPQESRWIRFTIQNIAKVPRKLLLEFTNANIYHGRIYSTEGDSVRFLNEFGIKYPFSHRSFMHPNIILPLELGKNSISTYWIEILPAFDSSNFNLILWEKSFRERYETKELVFFIIYTFIHFVFLIILTVVLFITKQQWQWSLFVYVLLGAIYKYVDLGLAFMYIWPDYPLIQQVSPVILLNIYSTAAIFFIRRYFDTQNRLPLLDRFYQGLILLYVLIVLIRIFNLFVLFPSPILVVFQSINSFLVLVNTFLVIIHIGYFLYKRIAIQECIGFLLCFAPPMLVFIMSSLRQLNIYAVNTLGLFEWPIFLAPIDVENLFIWAILWEVMAVILLLVFRLDKLFKDNSNIYLALENERKESIQLLMSSIEGERKRVARELHDGSGVSLSAIRMKMTYLKDILNDSRAKDKLTILMNDMDQVSHDIREISHFIMPISLSKLGLKAGVNELFLKVKKAYPDIDFQLFQQYDENILTKIQQINIYRICQELLNNTIKHALAKQVSLNLIQDDKGFSISIEDDGEGFDTEKTNDGMGMNNIKLRTQLMKGKFEVESKKMSGSFFHIFIPIC